MATGTQPALAESSLNEVIETTEAATEAQETQPELSEKEKEILKYFLTWPESEQRRFIDFASWLKSNGKI